MKIIIAALILAGCLYGAFAHLQAQEERIATAERAKSAAAAKKDASVKAVEELNRKVQETCEKLEAAKAAAFEQIKADLAADFAKQKAALDQELEQAKALSIDKTASIAVATSALQAQASELEQEIARTLKDVAKEEQLNGTLLNYVRAEEAKTKTKTSFGTYPQQNRITATSY